MTSSLALALTQRGRAGMGCVPRAGCWLLSFQYVRTCCGLGGRTLTALLQVVVDEGLYFYLLGRLEMSKQLGPVCCSAICELRIVPGIVLLGPW